MICWIDRNFENRWFWKLFLDVEISYYSILPLKWSPKYSFETYKMIDHFVGVYCTVIVPMCSRVVTGIHYVISNRPNPSFFSESHRQPKLMRTNWFCCLRSDQNIFDPSVILSFFQNRPQNRVKHPKISIYGPTTTCFAQVCNSIWKVVITCLPDQR